MHAGSGGDGGAGASPWGGGGMDWASLPTKPKENLPAAVSFNGRDVPIHTFAQIDRLGKKTLKDRAMNLRDLVGAAALPRFSPGMQDEQIVAWLLEAQTIVAAKCGVHLTVGDLGAPKGGDGVGAYLTHLQHTAPPPQQQQQQQAPPPQLQQRPLPLQHPPPPDTYEVETIVDVRTDPAGMATAFLVKWVGRGMEEASWEPAEQMQRVDPDSVFAFKQRLFHRQQQRQRMQQQAAAPPPPQQQTPPLMAQQQQQRQPMMPPNEFRPTDLRGNPLRSPQPFSPQDGSPMRPDQEADVAREAARKRNMGSNPFF